MNIAWYGHLKYKDAALWKVILVSWGIAFFEYLLIVPANRLGSGFYSLFQLKIIQEVITIIVFVAIAVLYFHEKIKWNYIAGFICIILAVVFVFKEW
jgi:uncharacterized protein (DUF486 family)